MSYKKKISLGSAAYVLFVLLMKGYLFTIFWYTLYLILGIVALLGIYIFKRKFAPAAEVNTLDNLILP